MPYTVFISSTTRDLKASRERLKARIKGDSIHIVQQEQMTAAGQGSTDLSVAYVRNCDILVVLIAFTRGSPSHDDPKRSIVQAEVAAAQKSGAVCLFFLLEDTPTNREAWAKKGLPNDMDTDSELVRWRKEVERQEKHTCAYFQADGEPDAIPAIYEQVAGWDRAKRRRWRAAFLLVAAMLLLIVTVPTLLAVYSQGFQEALLSRMHAYHDPVVFQHQREGNYKVARLLETRSDLQDNTNMRDEIGAANESFVMFANTLGSFRQYAADYEAAAARGVKLRFVVTDFSEPNRPTWEAFQLAIEDAPENFAETKAVAANVRKMMSDLKKRYPANFDYRLNKRPIFYTLWVRDPDRNDGMAHLSVHYYGPTSQSPWPSYRVSRRTGGGQLGTLQHQFEDIWTHAVGDR